jgi:uncharacterized surface protein with fasciclin (FAS1) repeats
LAGGQNDLSRYVVEGVYTVDVLQEMLSDRGGTMSLPTVDGGELSLVLNENGAIIIEGVAGIISAGDTVANGVVLTIDNVFSSTVSAQEGDVAGGGEAEEAADEAEETDFETDEAEDYDFAALLEAPRDAELLYHHVVVGVFTVRSLQRMLEEHGGSMTMKTLAGGELVLVLDNAGAIVVDGVAGIRRAATVVGNGAVIPIDHVLTPSIPAE